MVPRVVKDSFEFLRAGVALLHAKKDDKKQTQLSMASRAKRLAHQKAVCSENLFAFDVEPHPPARAPPATRTPLSSLTTRRKFSG